MNVRLLFLLIGGAAGACGQYAYENVVGPSIEYPNPANWAQNGGYGYDVTNGIALQSSGSFIYVPSIVSGTNANDYEVRSTFAGCDTPNFVCIHYVRASSDASAFAAGIVNGASCQACVSRGNYTSVQVAGLQLAVYQCSAGSCTSVGGTTLSAPPGLMRTVVWGTNLWVFINDVLVWTGSVPLTYGQPGVGGRAESSYNWTMNVTDIHIGHRDATQPLGVVHSSLRSSIVPTSASLQWEGAADDSNGIGVYGYSISRNDVGPVGFSKKPLFVDSVSAGTSYTYTVAAIDYHGNTGPTTSWTIATPPANSVDPRRTGIYNTGSYWGGQGEQIDTLSGNLNYSVPLLAPRARPGWTIPINLTYTSQNWRQDDGVNWQLAEDVGYGFGWRLQIGSVAPYYQGFGNGVHHYVYTDSSGAEYRLDQNDGNGIWSSKQSIYVWFDMNTSKLYFRNGTFWVMGSTSGGSEPDAGTMYPTVIEDSSGNYITIAYQAGAGVSGSVPNSSARISWIADARAVNGYHSDCVPSWVQCPRTYLFSYSTLSGDSIAHLSSIGNTIGSAESYSGFSYGSGPVSVQPAFGPDSTYSGVTTRQLTSIAVPAAGTFTLAYDSAGGSQAGASELTQVTFPWGGHLAWNYIDANYAGSRKLREVGTRYLAADSAGAIVWTYPFTHSDSGGSIATVHADTTLEDASGDGAKKWTFLTSGTTPWQIGLISQFTQLSAVSGSTLTQDSYTWTQGPAPSGQIGNPYISQKTSVRDGLSAQSQTMTQTLDMYGNVTQSIVYPYNNTTTPLQTYTNTYITTGPLASQYIAAYIRDRLTLSTITTGGSTANLVQNYYDQLYDNVYATLGCPSGSSSGNLGMWAGFPHTYSAWPLLGMISSSITPTRSTCSFHSGGVPTMIKRTDGPGTSVILNSSTGYAAPSAISVSSDTTSLSYSAFLGITQTTGPNGEQMYMTYDGYGRPHTATSPFGTYGTPTVTYTYVNKGAYDPFTGLYPSAAEQIAVGPDGFTRKTLDGLGRPIKLERGTDVNHIQSVVDTVYGPCACSPMGKIQSVSQPHAPAGTVYSTVYSYDGIGRTVSVRQPDGASTTSYLYTGNQTKVTDPAGKWKQFTTDELGNLAIVTEPDPANAPNGTLSTYYTYDWMKHLTCSDMTRGGTPAGALYTYTSNGVTCTTGYTGGTRQTRTFVYDGAGRLTSSTNPESGTVAYTYNPDNTLQKKHDAKGQEIVYTYDADQHVTKIQKYPAGTSGAEDLCQQVNYTYGTDPSQFNVGRLITVAYGSFSGSYHDPNGGNGACVPGTWPTTYAESYGYMNAGAVALKGFYFTRLVGHDGSGNPQYSGGGTTVSYTYDAMGRTASMSYPMGDRTGNSTPVSLAYTYDSMGRLSGMTNWVQGVQYDFAGRLTQFQYPKSTTVGTALETETMTYKADTGQIASIAWSDNWNTGTLTPVGSLLYSYSATQNNGQITQVDDQISKETIVYQYDSLKRLISAASTPDSGNSVPAWTQTYSYDGFGNLMGRVTNGTTYSIPIDAATNRVSGASYDLNGNSTQGGTITYDISNRMLSYAVSVGGATDWYGYSPDNKRIYHKKSNGVEEWTLWGARGENLGTFAWTYAWDANSQSYIGDFHATASNVYFAGRLISDGNQVCSGTNCTRAAFQDRLGTNRASGARYYPYGDEIGGFTATSNDREKFGTYLRDSFSGLDYADQRYYASAYGRFNTVDPAAAMPKDPGTWNRYTYVGGDPVNRSDPSGLCYTDQYGDSWEDSDVPFGMIAYGYELNYQGGSCGGQVFANDLGNCNDATSCMVFAGGTGDGVSAGGGGGVDPIITSLAPTPTPIAIPTVPVIGPILWRVFGGIWGVIFAPVQTGNIGGFPTDTFPTIDQLTKYCTPKGNPVIVPATRRGNRDGGKSIEQEYVCPDGSFWTVHTLVDKNGNVLEEHVRPGSPKYGNP
jgi:RHS repeat-associated protein